MREKSGLEINFKDSIEERESSSQKRIEKIQNGLIASDRINTVKQEMSKNFLYTAICKFSAGYSFSDLIKDYNQAVLFAHESWNGFWKLKGRNGIEYDQYILSAYDEMLWMLSLGYLLDIPNETFKKLVEVIDRDKVKDDLFEFIISVKVKDRPPINEESYLDYYGIPETFAKLREAIKETDKANAEKLVKEFITKDWYRNHKDAGWYNSHKSKHNVYFGYWSFETAAVVKIMGLNDSSFRDCQYYPEFD